MRHLVLGLGAAAFLATCSETPLGAALQGDVVDDLHAQAASLIPVDVA